MIIQHPEAEENKDEVKNDVINDCDEIDEKCNAIIAKIKKRKKKRRNSKVNIGKND